MVTGATKDTAIDCFTVSKENAIIHNSLSNKAGRLYNEHKALLLLLRQLMIFFVSIIVSIWVC